MRDFVNVVQNRNLNEVRNLIQLARRNDIDVCVWGCGKIGRTLGKEILDFLNIKIDYYCDKNEKLCNQEIIDGIYCKESFHLFQNTSKTVCFVLLGFADIESGCDFLINNNIKYMVTYDDLCELPEVIEHFLSFTKKNTIAIYTCITGDYDYVREPEYISENCEYYLISEKPPQVDSVYNWLSIQDVIPKEITNPIFQNRYCKMHPHLLFPNYRYSIYIDGNITITSQIEKFCEKLKSARIAVFNGNFSKNYFNHAIRMLKMGSENEELALKQLKDYWNKGFDFDMGTFYCGILIREHNNPVCVKIMEDWWEEYMKYIKRDQASFPYALWKNGFKREDVLVINEETKVGTYYKNPFYKYEKRHVKERYIEKKEYRSRVYNIR